KTVGVKDKAFAAPLFDENLRVKKRLFMTATERVVRGRHDDVVSMNDEAIYGACFHELSFKDASMSLPLTVCCLPIRSRARLTSCKPLAALCDPTRARATVTSCCQSLFLAG